MHTRTWTCTFKGGKRSVWIWLCLTLSLSLYSLCFYCWKHEMTFIVYYFLLKHHRLQTLQWYTYYMHQFGRSAHYTNSEWVFFVFVVLLIKNSMARLSERKKTTGKNSSWYRHTPSGHIKFRHTHTRSLIHSFIQSVNFCLLLLLMLFHLTFSIVYAMHTSL